METEEYLCDFKIGVKVIEFLEHGVSVLPFAVGISIGLLYHLLLGNYFCHIYLAIEATQIVHPRKYILQ